MEEFMNLYKCAILHGIEIPPEYQNDLERMREYVLQELPQDGVSYYNNLQPMTESRENFIEVCQLLQNRAESVTAHIAQYDELISSEGGIPRPSELINEIAALQVKDFKILFLGVGSSGKSTAINALLGQHILPASAGETTTIFTEIRYGDTVKLFVLDAAATTPREIEGYSTAENPVLFLKNYVCDTTGKYQRVFIELPHKLLRGNITFVDCPGASGEQSNNRINEIMHYSEDCAAYFWILNQCDTRGLEGLARKLSGTIDKQLAKPVLEDSYFGKLPTKQAYFILNKYDDMEDDQGVGVEVTRRKALEEAQTFVDTTWGEATCMFLSGRNAFKYVVHGNPIKREELQLFDHVINNVLPNCVQKCYEEALQPLLQWFMCIIRETFVITHLRARDPFSPDHTKKLQNTLKDCKSKLLAAESALKGKMKDIIATNQENTCAIAETEEGQRIIDHIVDDVVRTVSGANIASDKALDAFILAETKIAISRYFRWIAVKHPEVGLGKVLEAVGEEYKKLFYVPVNIILEAMSTLKYRMAPQEDHMINAKILSGILGVVALISAGAAFGAFMITPVGPTVIFGVAVGLGISATGAVAGGLGYAIFRGLKNRKEAWQNLTRMQREQLIQPKIKETIQKFVLKVGPVSLGAITKLLEKKITFWSDQMPELINRCKWEPIRMNFDSLFEESVRNRAIFHLKVIETLFMYKNEGIAEKDLRITSERLGAGVSGKVFLGAVQVKGQWIDVAVKTFSSRFNGESWDHSIYASEFDNYSDSFISFISERDVFKKFATPHENIITCYGWFVHSKKEADQEAFCGCSSVSFGMVFEIGQPIKLDAIRNTPEEMRLQVFLQWLREFVRGLIYMHQQSFIHRDIKPGNLVLCDNVVKLIDFGQSNSLSFYTNTFAGSAAYVAPEVCQNSRSIYGQKADVFSVGSTALRLWYGSPSNTETSTRMLPTEINELLLKCTSSCPEDRPFLFELLDKLE